MSGTFYVGVAKYAGFISQLIISMILARILTPEDYGIVAIATVFIAFFNEISDIGIGVAVIQRKDLNGYDLDHLYSINVYIGVILSLLFFSISGRGKMYFDFEKYSKLDYIVTKFRYINIQEMVYLFKNSEFVVCPYKDATQSGVVQTAFSLNAPVLATNVGALSSMIENEITGKIIPPNDDRILANSIVNLATKPNIIKDMKKNIELIWRPQMKWATIAKEYISIYEHLLK